MPRPRKGRDKFHALKESFPLDPHDLELGSWVYRTPKGVGCKACTLAKSQAEAPCRSVRLVSTSLTRGDMQITRMFWARQVLRKHEQLFTHLAAVAALTGSESARARVEERTQQVTAPPLEAFRKVLDARRRGGPLTPIPGVCGSEKRERIEFLIGEAIKMEDQQQRRRQQEQQQQQQQ